MKRVLVAFDGSEGAERAARLGGQWAACLGAEVVLVYSIPPLPALGEVSVDYEAGLSEGYRQFAQRVLDHGTSLVGGAPVSTHLTEGSVAEAICALSKAPEVELVVVGGGARSLLSRALLGSVTTRLLHICPKSVLVAR